MARGPAPKRSDQRRRRNADNVEIVEIVGGDVEIPLLRNDIHPLARRWYESLAESGQARFYEPSDWMTAQVIAEAIEVFAQKRNASMLSAILTGNSLLLGTEGDRRRARLELMRAANEQEGNADNVIDWRARASAGS